MQGGALEGTPTAKARRGSGWGPEGADAALERTLSRAPSKKGASSRKHLNQKLLSKVLAAVRRLPQSGPFKGVVPKTIVDDYNQFVDPADEMHLDKIGKKINALKYTTAQQLRTDMMQIYLNCKAYNEEGKGKHGGPILIESAAALVSEADRVLAENASEISATEQRIQEEAATRGVGPGPAGAVDAAAGGVAGKEEWVQCTRCTKWRNISEAMLACPIGAYRRDAGCTSLP